MLSRWWSLIPVFLVCYFCQAVTAKQTNWVLIVAGAKDYSNYFSQSTACHAYKTVRKAGVPAQNIIQMSYDDVANSPHNPYPGNLVVVPGQNSTNMYDGCKIDYKGKDVTPELFLKVLKGDKKGVQQLIGRVGPVINSGPDDHVFVTMVDHGGPGVFYFPGFVPLHASDLNNALKDMHTAKSYKQMVLYVESCESGSMFYKLLPEDINIYGSTCANPTEPGYMCCFDNVRKVFVGTYYANGWEFDSDKGDVRKETLAQQFDAMKTACRSKSHPQEYGNVSIHNEVLGEFQGNLESAGGRRWELGTEWAEFLTKRDDEKLEFAGIDLINPPMDMVTLATLVRSIVESTDLTPSKVAAVKAELFKSLDIKRTAEEFVKDIVVKVVGPQLADDMLSDKQAIVNSVCYKEALETLTNQCPGLHFGKFPFIRRNLHSIINLCNTRPYMEVIEGIKAASVKQPMC